MMKEETKENLIGFLKFEAVNFIAGFSLIGILWLITNMTWKEYVFGTLAGIGILTLLTFGLILIEKLTKK
jgi:hypothetical protein